MDLDQYLGIFIDESKDNLLNLNQLLLELEKKPDNSQDFINDIFRVAHTLKGMSGTMGFNNLSNLTHHMENLLDNIRKGKIAISHKIIDTLFKCLDYLEKIVDTIADNTYDENARSDQLNQLLNLIESHGQSSDNNNRVQNTYKEQENPTIDEGVNIDINEYESNVITSALNNNYKCYLCKIDIDEESMLPSVRAYMVLKTLEEHGEVIKTEPSAEEIEADNFHNTFSLIYLTELPFAEIEPKVKDVMEVKNFLLIKQGKDILTTPQDKSESSQQNTGDNVTNPTEKATLGTDQAESKTTPVKVPHTVRVNADRLDSLMNLVGELVVNRTRITQLAEDYDAKDLSTAVSQMGSITTNIQEIVMKLRMVAVEQVFNRFPRLVRDISKDLGKEVDLRISGQDTEIDRIVIDEIGDPLVHLIRNSLDHAIEAKEEREKTNKPLKGTIALSALNEGDNIVITIEDDGKGINPEFIKQKAIKKGFLAEKKAQTMSGQEIINLIFLPGFSTHDQATDLSGRGVGMDVVRSKVSSLGGDVTIASTLGEGTKISIVLPSTMAIVQALLINLQNECYAIPLNTISEVIDIQENDIKYVQGRQVILLRGNTVPLINLNQLFETKPLDHPSEKIENSRDNIITVVIIKIVGKQIGFIVTKLIGQQEVVIKPLSKKLCNENFFSGATILGNGKVALIINTNAIVT